MGDLNHRHVHVSVVEEESEEQHDFDKTEDQVDPNFGVLPVDRETNGDHEGK